MTDSTSDDELIARVAEADRDALTLLFRRWHRHVYRYALHVSGSTAVAEDVVQEVFLAVMNDAARYQTGRSGVKAWLAGIARNQARRHLESDRNHAALDDVVVTLEAAAPNDVLGDLTREERLAALRRAVTALPLRYREVVVLCDLQELSYADAAVALDCAVGTVRSRLHRGRALLAAKMAALETGEHSPASDGARCLA